MTAATTAPRQVIQSLTDASNSGYACIHVWSKMLRQGRANEQQQDSSSTSMAHSAYGRLLSLGAGCKAEHMHDMKDPAAKHVNDTIMLAHLDEYLRVAVVL